MINLIANKIEGTDNGWLVHEVHQLDDKEVVLSEHKVFCSTDNNTSEAAINLFPIGKRHVEKGKIIDAPVMKEIEVMGQATVEIVDGKAVMYPAESKKELVPEFEEYDVCCPEGMPITDNNDEPLKHKVPKTEKKISYYADKVAFSEPELPAQNDGESEADYLQRCDAATSEHYQEELNAAQNASNQEIEELKSSLMAL